MERELIHDLTPAYALDALGPDEQRRYEDHLARCERCREELVSLRETTAALAYAVDAPAPPPALRERILAQAASERRNVVPLRRPWFGPALAATASVAAAAAIVLAIWAGSLDRSLDRDRAALQQRDAVIAILASKDARRIPLSGGNGSLVVARDGEAALALSGLERAPEGKTYQAWVMERGEPRPAGTFEGGAQSVLRLTRRVERGTTVAVTVEREGGAQRPTTRPLLFASHA